MLESFFVAIVNFVPSIFVFFIIFSCLILVHEWGHFFTARKCGVKVLEFGLGMGKKLFSKKRGGVEYTINAVPFGGFVRMLGEEEKSNDPRSFEKAKLWKRMSITLAGIFMNFVAATVALTILFSVGTAPILITQQNILDAEIAGLVVLDEPDENGDRAILEISNIQKPVGAAFIFSITESWRISGAIVDKLAEIPSEIIQHGRLPEGMAGPVGIAEATHKILPMGFLAILKLWALLSLSLAVINLLPIPALDGGRFLFQIVEFVLWPFRVKINSKLENAVHVGGYVALMGLLVAVTWNDIVRIFF
ncbi:site-2 protease family protein [bacterium]|jgi:regulator of sigma E protease|nr:site-2 protease family protein [bacterium]MBT6831802.1 site-2 protease family protein [bacterium]MBT6996751.1 site-2 protease family protein [bacterium]MBT7772199.1 site-2 protease family protein [bacterium]